MAALVLMDISRYLVLSLLAVDDRENAVAASGGLVVATRTVIASGPTDGRTNRVNSEIGRLSGAVPSYVIHAAAKIGLPGAACETADVFVGDVYAGHEVMQLTDGPVRHTFDHFSGFAAHGATADADEVTNDIIARAERVLAGEAWLSPRQYSDWPIEAHNRISAEWLDDFRTEIQKIGHFVSSRAGSTTWPDSVSWPNVLDRIDFALATDSVSKTLLRGKSLGCMTPLSVMASQRDIVYLVPSLNDGVAIRFFGGPQYRREPEVLTLDLANVVQVRDLVTRLDSLLSNNESIDTDIASFRARIGETLIKPVLDQWPDLHRVALLPLGDIARLPLSTALVDGKPWAEAIDITLTPTTSSLFTAVKGSSPNATKEASIMGDPGGPEGLDDTNDLEYSSNTIPWVRREVQKVASVYSTQPDLLVEYEPTTNTTINPEASGPRLRSLREFPSIANIGEEAEYVLVGIESSRIVHLACHGYSPQPDHKYESEVEESPALFLGGRIPYQRLMHHRFARRSCFVLSACSVGSHASGVATLGMPAMLLATGVQNVIASLWPIPDCSETVDFMVELHHHLRDGVAPATALAAAIAAAQDLGYSYTVWGGFSVYGA